MGDAGGVSQAGIARVFSIAPGAAVLSKLGRSSVVEAAVGPDFVVLLSPVCDLGTCIEAVLEPAGAQTLLAQPSVEALHVAVLHGASGLDVASSIFHSSAQARKWRLVSSGPLSQRIACGRPRCAITSSSTRVNTAACEARV